MIYDKILTVCDLGHGSSPVLRKLIPGPRHYYAERTVYASRFYAGRQAGVELSRMVSVPTSVYDQPIKAEQYVILDDGNVYRIDLAQREQDEDGLPITTLTLAVPEGKYELLKDQGSP